MTIECFALPEVGKSTIIEDLKKGYGVESVSRDDVTYFNSLTFAFKHPVTVSRFILTFLKEGVGDRGGWKIVRFKLAVFINTIARIQVSCRNNKSSIVMIDEGLVQRILSLYETKQSPDKYISLLKKIPIADSILFLEYKGESDRIKRGRVGTMRRSIDDNYTEIWRSTMLHNYNSIVKALKALSLINVSYVRGDNRGFDLSLVMKDLELRQIKYCKDGK